MFTFFSIFLLFFFHKIVCLFTKKLNVSILVFNRMETKKWKRFDYWIKRQENYGSDIWIDFKKGNIVLDFSNKIVKSDYAWKVEEW